MGEQTQIDKIAPAISFAQKLPYDHVHTLSEIKISESTKSAYKKMKILSKLHLATYNRGQFTVKKDTTSQPLNVIKELIPSLLSLKQARRFGKYYRGADINFFRRIMPKSSIITLDYKAWEMTKYQAPHDLFVYVTDVDKMASYLKNNGFNEGKKGRIVLLPKIGLFSNKIQRVFLDCIAKGGRSTLDAIAIKLTYENKINIKAQFSIGDILKVQNNMPGR